MKLEIQKAKERATLALKDATSESQLQKIEDIHGSNQPRTGQGRLMVLH